MHPQQRHASWVIEGRLSWPCFSPTTTLNDIEEDLLLLFRSGTIGTLVQSGNPHGLACAVGTLVQYEHMNSSLTNEACVRAWNKLGIDFHMSDVNARRAQFGLRIPPLDG